MKRLLLVIGGSVAAGYVLGARAGRQRFEQIKSVATQVKEDPRVQEATHKVTDAVKEQAPVVKDKLGSAAGAAVSKVKPGHAEAEEPGAETPAARESYSI